MITLDKKSKTDQCINALLITSGKQTTYDKVIKIKPKKGAVISITCCILGNFQNII